MDRLTELENRSIYIIREAYSQFRRPAVLWSVGKDSTTLVWLCRKAFFGKLPMPVVHIDTTHKFPEMYEFRDRMVKEWGLDLIVARNDEALARGVGPQSAASKLECCTELKTNALKQCIARHGFDALLLAIRRDEHGIRAKERHFSPRDKGFRWNYEDQPPELWDQYTVQTHEECHTRVHPMLEWRELDVWLYIQREKLPVNALYLAKDAKRYRSLGCKECCTPVDSLANTVEQIVEEVRTAKSAERAGRAQDKEDAYTMQKLRSLGYM